LLISLGFSLRRKMITLGGMMLVGMLVWYLPEALFEITHSFVLTKLLIFGQTLPQETLSLSEKIRGIELYLLVAGPKFNLLLVFLISVSLIWGIWYLKRKQQATQLYTLIFYAIHLLALLIFSLIFPIDIEAHYIFGLLALSAFALSLLPWRVGFSLVIIITIFWLQPNIIQLYVQPPPRTIDEMKSCYQQFCYQHQQPLYVSMESGLLPFHNGPEHRYMLSVSGCQTLNITEHQDQAPYMAVIADSATYEHGKTAYYELTQFGPAEEVEQITCSPTLKIHLLRKAN